MSSAQRNSGPIDQRGPSALNLNFSCLQDIYACRDPRNAILNFL